MFRLYIKLDTLFLTAYAVLIVVYDFDHWMLMPQTLYKLLKYEE